MNVTPQPEPLTITPAEAAPMVPMGINQLYAAIKAGEIPSLKIGTRIRIPRKKFLAFLEGEDA